MAKRNNPNEQIFNKEVQGNPFYGNIDTAQIAIENQLDKLYVAGSAWQPYPAIRTLGNEYDEFTCKLGFDVLRKMSLDSEISASIGIYLSAIFSRDLEFLSPITDADHPLYDVAQRIASNLQNIKENADFSWEEQLRIVCKQALTYGTSLLEHQITYEEVFANVNGWNINYLNPLGIDDYRLVVDNYDKVIGAVPFINGLNMYANISGMLPLNLLNDVIGVVAKEKFSVFAFNRTSSDARGTSILTPAYPSWWLKQQLLLEFSAFIKRFAPVIYGTVSATAIPRIKKINGVDVIVNPVDELNNVLQKLRNGSVAALAHGTTVGVLDLSKSGDFFISAIKLLDLQSARAITRQHLASGEGEHQARSASEVHQDILVLGINEIKQFMSRQLRLGLSRTWTVLNFGKSYGFLAPIPSFGRGSGLPLAVDDIIKLHQTGYLTPEQYPQTDSILDLTPRAADVVEQGNKLLEDSRVDEKTKESVAKALNLLKSKHSQVTI